MGEGGCMYVVGEKKKRKGVHGWWGKKIKRKMKWGVGYTCMVGKKGEWKKKEEKKIEREKTKLVLFVCSLYLV
jgi:hypothetical protein